MSEVMLRGLLVVAAALVATGVYGALSQQSIVMLMMGLELAVNGLVLAAGTLWRAVAPGGTDGPVLVLVLVVVMAVEMALGFAVVVALYRARGVDTADAAADLRG